MSELPSAELLTQALRAAGAAHHDYESHALNGVRDEQWAGWYAAYVLGRLGDFATPTTLSAWLSEAPAEGDWAIGAATYVEARMTDAL